MLLAPDGRRLSKRDGDLDMSAQRRRMKTEVLIGALGYTAGLLEKPEAVSAMELARDFSWDRVRKDDISMDSAVFTPLCGG